ncbi:MAG: cobalamin biosynthesis protein [Bacteroidales bacterium]
MSKTAIFSTSESGNNLAKKISEEFGFTDIFTVKNSSDYFHIDSFSEFVEWTFDEYKEIVLIGDLVDSVCHLSPYLSKADADLLILNIDINGDYVQILKTDKSGKANFRALTLAGITSGEAILSTQAKASKDWELETLADRFDWEMDVFGDIESVTALFRKRVKVALLLETRDSGSAYLERTCPSFADIFYHKEDVCEDDYEMLIAVSPLLHHFAKPTIIFRPKVLTLGMGCHKDFPEGYLVQDIRNRLKEFGVSYKSVRAISTSENRAQESALLELSGAFHAEYKSFSANLLNRIEIPNPSEVILKHTGYRGVAESASLAACKSNSLVIEKQNDKSSGCNQYFTWSLAIDQLYLRKGQLEVIGVGPGDIDLLSVHGKYLIERADMILYSQNTIPEELIQISKKGAALRSTDKLDQKQIVELVYSFYKRGLMTVWLLPGDACLFNNIQNQLNSFSDFGLEYRITPGVSVFQSIESKMRSKYLMKTDQEEFLLYRINSLNLESQKTSIMEGANEFLNICIHADRNVVPDLHSFLQDIYGESAHVVISTQSIEFGVELHCCELKDMAKVYHKNITGEAVILRIGMNLTKDNI